MKSTRTCNSAKLRIIQIVPSVEQEASGPSYSVPRLALALTERGNDVHLITVGGQTLQFGAALRHTRHRKDWAGIKLLNSLWLSRELKSALPELVRKTDIVHVHSMWNMPTVYSAQAATRAGTPFIVSPRGSFSPDALVYSRFRKRLFWQFLQRGHVRRAACLHATSQQEYRDIRNFGLTQPVAIIPNGIDLPPRRPRALAHRQHRRILYLGRVHPIKGLENLLRAWHRVCERFPAWELRLVGPDEHQYATKLQRISSKVEFDRVTFAGPRYGAEKDAEYAAADLFVLPSFSENFGMSVAEALASATPAITTTGMPWINIREEGCGWSVSPDIPGIEGALSEALAMSPQQLDEMGQKGRTWMVRDFSWNRVAQQMEAVYRWVLEGGTVPASVRRN